MPGIETTEFQMDSCVLVVTTYTKKLGNGWHFAKELSTEREFSNFVDCYTVAMKKVSSDFVSSGFENLFGSDHARFVAKSFKHKHCTKNLARNSKSYKTN